MRDGPYWEGMFAVTESIRFLQPASIAHFGSLNCPEMPWGACSGEIGPRSRI
jgi:hypothetical protein